MLKQNKLVVANWKMNGSLIQLEEDLTYYINELSTQANVALALPHIFLYPASLKLKQDASLINLAAQDLSSFSGYGSFTGEVSGTQLKELNIKFALIGHSERRTYFIENEATLTSKIINAITNGITPIFCIGENLELRKESSHFKFLIEQLKILKQVEKELSELVIAYEPVWAIGTGIVPTLVEIEQVAEEIYNFMQANLPHVRITTLYGGSVTENNIDSILRVPRIEGVLVGGASLNRHSFKTICEASLK
jgi:triosephosphate isomerase